MHACSGEGSALKCIHHSCRIDMIEKILHDIYLAGNFRGVLVNFLLQ